MEQESIYDWLWLLLVFGAGSRKIWKLLEQYETPQKVRQVLQTETDLPFIHEREQRSIRSITNEQIGKLMQNCAEKRIELVAYDDENYPESLRQIYNPPVVLFYQGQLSVLSDYPALTVVGTRKPSSYSIRTADLLCRCLAKSGMLSEIVCYGPFDRMPENLMDNVYWFGGWECRTPGYTQKMEAHGITNPYRDVINNDSIYLVDDNIDLTLKYIRQYYDSSAQAVFIKTIGNVDVYQIRSK